MSKYIDIDGLKYYNTKVMEKIPTDYVKASDLESSDEIPSNEEFYASKDELNLKVDKITSEGNQVYVAINGEQTSRILSTDAVENTIVQRSTTGTIKTNIPTEDLDATNKNYVDELINPLQEDVNNIKNLIPTEASLTNQLADKASVPSSLSQLTDDSTHRLITDSDKTTWDNYGSYLSLLNNTEFKAFASIDIASSRSILLDRDIDTITFWECSKFNTLSIDDKILCFVKSYDIGTNEEHHTLFKCTITSVNTSQGYYRVDASQCNLNGMVPSASTRVLALQSEVNEKVSKTGDSISGTLIINSTDSSNQLDIVNEGDALYTNEGYPSLGYTWIDETEIQANSSKVFTFSNANIFPNVDTYITGSFWDTTTDNTYATVENVLLPTTITLPGTNNVITILAPTERNKLVIRNDSNNIISLYAKLDDSKIVQKVPIDILSNVISTNIIRSSSNPSDAADLTRKDYVDNMWDKIYPVGSIYLTVNSSFSPSASFGGSWTKIDEGYALWTAASGADSTISAGLPNITGSVGQNYAGSNSGGWHNYNNAGYGSGALYLSGTNNGSSCSWQAYNDAGKITFDASKSNSIYGNSTTVQPPAYKVYAWKRVS